MPAEQTRSALSLPGSRAVLVGCGQHAAGSRLPDVSAIRDSLTDLAEALTECCGLDPARIRLVLDPDSPQEFGGALVAAAEEATDALLVYYAGHGLLGRDRQLYLATRQTVDLTRGIPGLQALPYASVAGVVEQCDARLIVVVLDCCFAGRAYGTRSEGADSAFDSPRRRGTYVLAAAGYEENAWAPPGERYTAFTGEFIRLLREGDPLGPPWMTIDSLYRGLDQALGASGYPRPRRQAGDTSDLQVFARNHAYREPAAPGLPGVAAGEAESPYRGLEPYDPQDAQLFFGRDAMTDALAARVAGWAGDLIVVTGPSGSGKSSLLRAGLTAAAEDGRVGRAGRRCLLVTPGSRPVERLARRLAEAGQGDFILLVDQFEEAFTPDVSEPDRQAFVDQLAGMARERPVVIGVRADFFGRCTVYPALVRTLENPFVVGPMTTGELRAVIEGPAGIVGLALQDNLVDLLLRDLGTAMGADGPGSAGVLPFLSYALLVTWRHREADTLTLDAYHATGGIYRAVGLAADAIVDSLPSGDQQIIRRVLVRLVRIGERTEDTRRSVALEDLLPPEDDPRYVTARAIVSRFITARLLTAADGTVTITHEALIRAWPRLSGWINDDRTGLLQWQRLTDAAVSWRDGGREPGELYQGQRLAAASEWADDPAHRDDVSALAREFLDASNTAQEQARVAELRRVRRRWQIAAAVAVLLVIALAAAGLAVQRNQAASRDASIATAQQLTSEEQALAGTQPRTALILGVAAIATHESSATRAGLLGTLTQSHYLGTLTGQQGGINSVAFDPRGNVLASASDDGTVDLWDVTTHVRIASFIPTGHSVASVDFNARGTLLAVGSGTSVTLWDVTNPQHPTWIAGFNAGGDPRTAFTQVLFSPGGSILATENPQLGATVDLWTAADPAHPRMIESISGPGGNADAMAFRPDGRELAVGGNQSTTDLYAVRAGGTVALLGNFVFSSCPNSSILGLAFTSDSQGLAAACGNAIQVWNISDPSQPVAGSTTFTNQSTDITGLALSVGGILASAGAQSDLAYEYIANPAQPGGYELVTLRGHTDAVLTVAFSADGSLLATGSADKSIMLWRTRSLAEPGFTSGFKGNTGYNSIAYAPDGKLMVTATDDFHLQIWSSDPANPSLLNTISVPTDNSAPPGILTADEQGVLDATFAPDSHTLATASFDSNLQGTHAGLGGRVMLWNITGKGQASRLALIGGSTAYDCVAFSPDGRTLAAGGATSNGGVVTLWNIEDRHQPRQISSISFPAIPNSVAIAPGGRVLAVTTYADVNGQPEEATIWDVSTAHPRLLADMPGTDITYDSVAFSHDGRTLALGGSNGESVLYNVANPAAPLLLSVTAGNSQTVRTVEFSPDDHNLITAGDDRTTVVWDITDPTTPIQMAVLLFPTSTAHATFTPDGKYVVTASQDDWVLWWPIAPLIKAETAPVANACAILGPRLLPAEWSPYMSAATGNALCAGSTGTGTSDSSASAPADARAPTGPTQKASAVGFSSSAAAGSPAVGFRTAGVSRYSCSSESTLRSLPSSSEVRIAFVNDSPQVVLIAWLTFKGTREVYNTLTPGQSYIQYTYVNHVWLIANSAANCLGIFRINQPGQIVIT
jgi:WD40 repeat protein